MGSGLMTRTNHGTPTVRMCGASCFNATGIDGSFNFSVSCVPKSKPGPSLFLVDPTEPFSEHKSRLQKYG
jgi:hypothetical protein